MTDKKKQTEKKEEIKLPSAQLGYAINTYIPTAKGLCIWMVPVGITFDESKKYLENAIELTDKAIKTIKEKEEEAAKNKLPSKNKVEKFTKI